MWLWPWNWPRKRVLVKKVVANDDVPSSPELEKRRGVAGEILMWKVGGAKAAMGASLDEVIAASQKPLTTPVVWVLVWHPVPSLKLGIRTLPSSRQNGIGYRSSW
jgi:hypothetical protein